MSTIHVLIVNKGSLLMDCIERVLETSGEFSIVYTLVNDSAMLVFEVERSRPDVVVIDDISFSIEPMSLITSLGNIRNIRFIILNSQFNRMDIYHKSEYTFSNSGQFIEAIR